MSICFWRLFNWKEPSPQPNKRREKNNLFYRFSALISRISLLTLASRFLIGLAIDCPPSHPLPSRWPITNKPSRKWWRSQKTQAAQGLESLIQFSSIYRRFLLTLLRKCFFKSFQFEMKSSEMKHLLSLYVVESAGSGLRRWTRSCTRFPPFALWEGHTQECDEEGTSVSKVFLHYSPIVRGRHLSKQRASIMHIHTNRCGTVGHWELEMERREMTRGGEERKGTIVRECEMSRPFVLLT